jgi:2-amino-4-hydroxy-6-hydroxymethyldihydropteridine diphosphokinase
LGDPVTAAVALGSNLGDRRAHLDNAVARLRPLLQDLRISRYYETVPVGVAEPQPLFLNAAAVGQTSASARELFAALSAIETELQRQRPYPNAPRTIDLDLVLFGNQVIEEPDLSVPHPRFRERPFVLEPIAEIAPEMRDPVSGKTVAELLAALKGS